MEEEEEDFTGYQEESSVSDDDSGDAEPDTPEGDVENAIPSPASKNRGAREGGDQDDEHEEPPKKSKAEVRVVERPKPNQQLERAPESEDESPETDVGSQFDHVEEEFEPTANNGRGSPVFDEYFELMEIAEGPQLPGLTPAGSPVDLNLVASLVRWASIAKHRVGEDRLRGVLELYFQSRPISPSLKDLLNQITEMADALPGDEEQTAQVCVDLISHLHGILTGGLPVGQVSQVVLPTKG